MIDVADDELPDVGTIVVEDAETGETSVDSGDPLSRARLRAGVDERDAALDGRMRRAGVPLHRIGPDRDLVDSLVEVVAGTLAARMSFASPWWLVLGALVVVTSRSPRAAARRRQAVLHPGRSHRWASTRGDRVVAHPFRPGRARCRGRRTGRIGSRLTRRRHGDHRDGRLEQHGRDRRLPHPARRGEEAPTRSSSARPDTVDIGVVAFQNGALTVDQPSADHASAQAAIDRLRISGGTSLGAAILTSLSAISGSVAIAKNGTVPEFGYWGSATILLFSDGEDQGSDKVTVAAATAAENAGVHIETVGVGTAAGATIQTNGYRVHTALRADELTAVAKTSGGTYHPASDAAELDGIASSINLRLTTHHESLPLAGAFTAFAIALLAAGGIVTVMRTGRVV